MSFTSKGPKEHPEKDLKPKADTPKYAPEKAPNKQSDKPAFDPNIKPKNKIERHSIPPNYKPKNKIEQQTIPPNYKPKNKIERHTIPPNYKPKNRIERPTLPPNYIPKNKITRPTLPPNYIPRNKIQRPGGSEVQPHQNQTPTEIRNTQLKPLNISKNPKTHQKLYNDGESKECGRCHQIKPLNEYATRMMRGKKTLRSICKVCKIQTEQIYRFKNKMKVVQNIYNGELKGKCQKCNTGIERLPTLEFHHPNPELKNKNNINLNLNQVKTKQRLEKEKATILCVNCHSKEISYIYNKYKEFIPRKNFGPDTTNKEIKQYVKSHISNPKHHNRVVQLIKKNEVIKQLYGGKCIACGKISTKDSLPALHFHHRDGKNIHPGSETFNAIKNKEINLMKKQLKEENCIVICGNCHKMERTFHFKNLYNNVIPREYWDQINLDYERIEKNIENFKFKQD